MPFTDSLYYRAYSALTLKDKRDILAELDQKEVAQSNERLFCYPQLTVAEFTMCYFYDQQKRIWHSKKQAYLNR